MAAMNEVSTQAAVAQRLSISHLYAPGGSPIDLPRAAPFVFHAQAVPTRAMHKDTHEVYSGEEACRQAYMQHPKDKLVVYALTFTWTMPLSLVGAQRALPAFLCLCTICLF